MTDDRHRRERGLPARARAARQGPDLSTTASSARASSIRRGRTTSTSVALRSPRRTSRSIPQLVAAVLDARPVDQVGVLRQPRDPRGPRQSARGDRQGAARQRGRIRRRRRHLERVRLPDRSRGLSGRPRDRVEREGHHGGARPRHHLHAQGRGAALEAACCGPAARLLPRRRRRVQEAERRGRSRASHSRSRSTPRSSRVHVPRLADGIERHYGAHPAPDADAHRAPARRSGSSPCSTRSSARTSLSTSDSLSECHTTSFRHAWRSSGTSASTACPGTDPLSAQHDRRPEDDDIKGVQSALSEVLKA